MEPSAEKIFDQVVPLFMVSHRPPAALATKMWCSLSGSTAMSMIRPPVAVGPTPRHWKFFRSNAGAVANSVSAGLSASVAPSATADSAPPLVSYEAVSWYPAIDQLATEGCSATPSNPTKMDHKTSRKEKRQGIAVTWGKRATRLQSNEQAGECVIGIETIRLASLPQTTQPTPP